MNRIAILVLAGALLAGYFYYQQNHQQVAQTEVIQKEETGSLARKESNRVQGLTGQSIKADSGTLNAAPDGTQIEGLQGLDLSKDFDAEK